MHNTCAAHHNYSSGHASLFCGLRILTTISGVGEMKKTKQNKKPQFFYALL